MFKRKEKNEINAVSTTKKVMRFKYDGIPVRHIHHNGHMYLLLLIKDMHGQYTNLALLSPFYNSINVYFLDSFTKYIEYPVIHLEEDIERDIITYEKRGETYENMLDYSHIM